VLHDVEGALEARVSLGAAARVLVDLAREPREILPELAERGVVRHDHQLLVRVQDAGGLHQLVGDQEGGRVIGRHLVLHQLARPGVLQLLGQDAGRVLVDRAERVVPAVPTLEGEPLRLAPAHAHDRLQAAREALQVQDLDLDRGRPQRPVVRPPQATMDGSGVVLRPNDDDARGGGSPAPGDLVRASERGKDNQQAGQEERVHDNSSQGLTPRRSAARDARAQG
jgi:hypothetical protein